MKRSAFSVLFIAFFLFSFSNAYAHAEEGEGAPRPPRPGFVQNFLQEREGRPPFYGTTTHQGPGLFRDNSEDARARMEERQQRFASSSILGKGQFSEFVKEMVAKRAEHAASLFDAMILRLRGLGERIDARIDVLKERGVDVADAEESLADALAKIDDAEKAIEEVKDAMSDALASETPREEIQNVRTLAETAKGKIREAHQALVLTITELPNAQNGGAQAEPSPTNE